MESRLTRPVAFFSILAARVCSVSHFPCTLCLACFITSHRSSCVYFEFSLLLSLTSALPFTEIESPVHPIETRVQLARLIPSGVHLRRSPTRSAHTVLLPVSGPRVSRILKLFWKTFWRMDKISHPVHIFAVSWPPVHTRAPFRLKNIANVPGTRWYFYLL